MITHKELVTIFPAILIMQLFIGCAVLEPVSGGVKQTDGTYLVSSNTVQITIFDAGAMGSKFGCLNLAVKNNSDSQIEIDHMRSIITTDAGEKLHALTPNQVHALAPNMTNAEKISRTAIVQSLLEPKGTITGKIYFSAPTSEYKSINIQLNGVPGLPIVSLDKFRLKKE